MFKGKALLVIDRIWTKDPKDFRWDIAHYPQSLNQEDPGDEVMEAFNCMEMDCLPAPAAAYKMEVGDRIRVAVSFEMHYHQSHEGDWDMDMYLTSVRVLRYQPYNSRRYRQKFYPFWKSTQTDMLTGSKI